VWLLVRKSKQTRQWLAAAEATNKPNVRHQEAFGVENILTTTHHISYFKRGESNGSFHFIRSLSTQMGIRNCILPSSQRSNHTIWEFKADLIFPPALHIIACSNGRRNSMNMHATAIAQIFRHKEGFVLVSFTMRICAPELSQYPISITSENFVQILLLGLYFSVPEILIPSFSNPTHSPCTTSKRVPSAPSCLRGLLTYVLGTRLGVVASYPFRR
jgi:hypothetical protein